MMRKTMEKRRDFDIKEWKKNGTAMETVERIGREQWDKNAKGEENDERNNRKKEGIWT